MALSNSQKADIAAAFAGDPAIDAATLAAALSPAASEAEVEAELDALRASSPKAIGSKEAAAMTAVLARGGSTAELYAAGAGNDPSAIEDWLDADTTGWRRSMVGSAPKPRRRGWVKPVLIVATLALVAWVATSLVGGLGRPSGDTAVGTAIPAAAPKPTLVGEAVAAEQAAELDKALAGLKGLAPLVEEVATREEEVFSSKVVAGSPAAMAVLPPSRSDFRAMRRGLAELQDRVTGLKSVASGSREYDSREADQVVGSAKATTEAMTATLRERLAVLNLVIEKSAGAAPGTVTAAQAAEAAAKAALEATAKAKAEAAAKAEAEVSAILARNPGFVGLMATVREGGELRYERSNSWQEGARRFLRGDGGYPLWHYLHAGEYQTGGLDLGSLGSEKSLLGFRDYCRVLTLQPERFPDAAVRARHPGMFPPPTGEMGREISVEQLLDMRIRDLQRKAPKALLDATWETRP